MKLHNTLGQKLETFLPHIPGEVLLYTCGPTVYDRAHIGNLRKYIFDDTLRRVLTHVAGLEVRHVANITDVGHLSSDADQGKDKLEAGATREGKTVWEVAAYYTKVFKDDMTALNIAQPSVGGGRQQNDLQHDSYARATDFIPEEIELIHELFNRGFAYQTKQAIYFEVAKLSSYGKLSGQRLSDKGVGVRDDVVTDTDKRDGHDFALWFFTVGHFADHSMHWASPWGEGFPGWHIECSAIIHTLLGDPIDIHTGGVDHIGTHHPNEMAQTEGAFGHELSRFWLHSEFLLADGHKMSKSKSNFSTLDDLTRAGYSPMVYRLFCLSAHYRSELSFSSDALTAAKNTLLNLNSWADRIHQVSSRQTLDLSGVDQALEDDLNTPLALARLQEQITLSGETAPSTTTLEELDLRFGLNLYNRPDIADQHKRLILDREQARRDHDYATADDIREQLLAEGITVRDTPTGSHWDRTTA